VVPPEVFTPGPPATITPIPDEVRALVVEVIDGDTITVVMEGDSPNQSYQVRYLGIDAPPNTPSAPWGVVAYETNRKLTNLKVVRLERDQTDFDEEGHLLRYVYVDNQLLSILLAEQGLARANIVEPDTRFEAEVLEAEARARQGNLGLWGSAPTPTPGISQPPGTEQAGTPPAAPTATTGVTGPTEPEAPAETPTPDASPTRATVTTTPEETDETEPTSQSTTENEAGNELQGPE
jgi:endonuclease YncB( thermonuclease family)